MDILKDASATAIYGSRGSNGVILITTRQGKKGKPVLTYDGYYGTNSVVDKYKLYNSEEFNAFRAEAVKSRARSYAPTADEAKNLKKPTAIKPTGRTRCIRKVISPIIY